MRKFQLVDHNLLNRFKGKENSLFKSVFDGSQEGIFFLDPESFNIIDCNKKAVELFQAEHKDNLIDVNAFSLYSSEPVGFSKRYLISKIAGGNEFSQELSFKSLKKNTFWARITLRIVNCDSDKVVIAHVNKVMEYSKSSELLDILIKQTSKVTGSEYFNVLSRLLCETFEVKCTLIARIHDDYKIAETIKVWNGDNFTDNFSFEVQNSPNSNVLNGYITFYPKKLPELFPDYSFFNDFKAESYLGVPIYSKEGTVTGFIIMLDDKPMVELPNARYVLSVFASRAGAEIERIKDEEKWQNDVDKYINACNTKDKLLKILVHDLKNPLNTMMGFSELLKLKINKFDKDKIKEIAEIIDNSSKNCNSFIEGMTKWYLETENFQKPKSENINLHNIVDEIFNLYHITAFNKNISLINDVDAKITLKADMMMIMTILRNFLGNAVKFSFHKSSIKISAESRFDELVITVEDNGTGMSVEEIEKIFSGINFSKTGTGNETGNGLGMELCRDFIKFHNGSFKIESNNNDGTKVIISLPQK